MAGTITPTPSKGNGNVDDNGNGGKSAIKPATKKGGGGHKVEMDVGGCLSRCDLTSQ